MFGFRATSVVWTSVKGERLQHCYRATCYRDVSEKLPQDNGEERITLWPYGQLDGASWINLPPNIFVTVHFLNLLLSNSSEGYLSLSFAISEAVALHVKTKEHVVAVNALQFVLQERPLSVSTYRPIAVENSWRLAWYTPVVSNKQQN